MRKRICLTLALAWNLAGAAPPPPATDHLFDSPATGAEACTLSARVYILTEAGLIGVGFSITAETCSEAYGGIREAISGFLSAF